MTVIRKHWLHHVKEVVRSRHYTWLPQGLGGESVEEAMTWLATDVMHICKLAGVPLERVMDRARLRFAKEETAQFPVAATAVEIPHVLPDSDSDRVVTAYESEDAYDAEIVRGILQGEGISCRFDSQSQGGFTDLAETNVVVHARDAEAAKAAISTVRNTNAGTSS